MVTNLPSDPLDKKHEARDVMKTMRPIQPSILKQEYLARDTWHTGVPPDEWGGSPPPEATPESLLVSGLLPDSALGSPMFSF